MNCDKYLIKIRDGDHDAFRILMKEYGGSLILFVSNILNDRESAEEIVQDVFVNIWINRRKISFDIPIKNYLYVTARNLAYNHIRDSKRSRARLEKIPPLEDIVVESFMIGDDAVGLLESAVNRLPPRTAQIIRMSMQGMNREDIANAMNVTISNVKNLKAKGIKKLRAMLDDSS